MFSHAITAQHFEDLAEMWGVEILVIDAQTTLRDFKDVLWWNDANAAR